MAAINPTQLQPTCPPCNYGHHLIAPSYHIPNTESWTCSVCWERLLQRMWLAMGSPRVHVSNLTQDPAGCIHLAKWVTWVYVLPFWIVARLKWGQHKGLRAETSTERVEWDGADTTHPPRLIMGHLFSGLRVLFPPSSFPPNIHILLLCLAYSYQLFRIQLKYYFFQEALLGCIDQVRAASCSLPWVYPCLIREQTLHLPCSSPSLQCKAQHRHNKYSTHICWIN